MLLIQNAAGSRAVIDLHVLIVGHSWWSTLASRSPRRPRGRLNVWSQTQN